MENLLVHHLPHLWSICRTRRNDILFRRYRSTEAYNERHIKRKTAFLPDKLTRLEELSGWPIDLEHFGNASDMYVDYVRVFAENDIQYSIPLPEKK